MLMGWSLQRLFRERVRDFSGCSVIGFGFCLREFDIRDIDVAWTAMIELEGPICIKCLEYALTARRSERPRSHPQVSPYRG